MYTKPHCLDLDPIDFTTAAVYADVRTELFYFKGYNVKLFKIEETGGVNGMLVRIWGGNRETLAGSNIIDGPYLLAGPFAIVADGVHVETFSDKWRYIQIEVVDLVALAHADGRLEVEAYT